MTHSEIVLMKRKDKDNKGINIEEMTKCIISLLRNFTFGTKEANLSLPDRKYNIQDLKILLIFSFL